ncbi:MAG: hypothetical protein IPM98_17765 [Lewinellaceae bacterium]|nr:hypothetical protein [Lewinellaceae bacterium]
MTEKRPVPVPPGFDWQGHRGARGLLPENTVPAFLRALEFPQVRTLELDVAVSKDKQLIVSHEPWFNPDICRLPGGAAISKSDSAKLLIYHLTAAEIRAFDCGSQGTHDFGVSNRCPRTSPPCAKLWKRSRNAGFQPENSTLEH